MTTASLAFAPGTLLRSLRSATGRALATGALRSIETDRHFIEQGGVRFLARSVSSLARRDQARIGEAGKSADGARRRNPFLPHDPDLFVADISPTHLCLLNKFNVMDHHMLIVTREFEDQRAPLTAADFAALWACLTEIDGLGFYNGGTAAGASQPHKHLQIVPLPLAPEGPAIPLEPLLDAATAGPAIQDLPSLPFANAFVRLEPSLLHDASAATVLERRYRTMLDRVGPGTAGGGEAAWPRPYNLLVTRRWMLLVPRSREHFETISINALGFAGSLFVRDREQVETIRRHGPMTALAAVAVPRDRPSAVVP